MFADFAEKIAAKLTGRQRAGLLFRLISENAWQYRRSYAVVLVLMALVAATGGAAALIMESVMDDVFIQRRAGMVAVIAAWVLVIFLVRGASAYGQTVLLGRIGNGIVAGLQTRIYDHVLAQGMAFHARHGTGALTTRITHNCNAARQALDLVATRLGTDLLSVVALVSVMLWQDITLSLTALVGLPVVLVGVAALVRRVRKLARDEITLQARIVSAMSETIRGARIIKAFRLEPEMRGRMSAAIEGVRERADRIVVLRGLVSPLMEAMAGVGAATVILYGGWRVIDGTMDTGSFFSFVTALFLAADPARRLAQLNVQLRQHLAGVEYIYAVLDTRSGIRDGADAIELAVTDGKIRFEDVRFTYGEAPALHGLNLVARPGEVTALVGPSGAGKSTVLALIERFYDATGGVISIDGQDIRGVRIASLRRQVALVTQETFLFDASVAENIGFGRPNATAAEIEAAARAANADEFISALEQGYATPVGEGGSRLSGGERQRIAIARAMLRDAPILLLDEATSALDAEAEIRVQEALDRLMAGRTTIVIAHRLATVRRADRICVMADGRVAEEGTHDVLVAKRGLYARLAALQFGQPADLGKERG
ncbi:MAG: ABC transporter ATP-binding protein [Hyphomicrobiales bacterium]|nr:MAG: ABC transporter ATP-binding protein [Hyphomicrobiales bacterium]